MKIAIVDGYSTGSALAHRLKLLGVDLLHIQSQRQNADFLQRSFRRSDYTHDFGFMPDLPHLADCLAGLGVSRVVAGSESGVTLAESLALKLGLPTNTPDRIEARRDKALMAQAVAEAGLTTPHATTVTSAAAAVDWFADTQLPEIVVKPLSSAGTDNVRFCRTAAEVTAACDAVLNAPNMFGEPNTAVLLQERLTGDEFYINTVSHDGLHKVAEIWRYTKHVDTAAAPIYDFEEPLDAAHPDAQLLREYVFKVLDALGIRSTPAHTEVMLTERGPVLIESGARLGGSTMPSAVATYAGSSQTDLFADTLIAPEALHRFDDNSIRWSSEVRIAHFINRYPGRFDAEGAAKVRKLRSAVAVATAAVPGDPLPVTGDLITSPGFVLLAADQREAVEQDYALLRLWEKEGLYAA
ncbi:ATP-grasp domain-containing protein [Streptomyces sp. NPDC058268]|uniref:ATP-grasp domain-containing protein n=1 Tax=Streptomyces sp. NPDC058268 TaxID=3346413 RepID=UPI0036EE2A68